MCREFGGRLVSVAITVARASRYEFALRVTELLAGSDEKTVKGLVEVLVTILESDLPVAALFACDALKNLGPASAPALPALLARARAPEKIPSLSPADSWKRYVREAKYVIGVGDIVPPVQLGALNALAAMGPAAAGAAPDLEKLLGARQELISNAAADALYGARPSARGKVEELLLGRITPEHALAVSRDALLRLNTRAMAPDAKPLRMRLIAAACGALKDDPRVPVADIVAVLRGFGTDARSAIEPLRAIARGEPGQGIEDLYCMSRFRVYASLVATELESGKLVDTRSLLAKPSTSPPRKRKKSASRRRNDQVDDDGDDYGLRVKFIPPSTVVVAVVVDRNGQENGGERGQPVNPLGQRLLAKRTCGRL